MRLVSLRFSYRDTPTASETIFKMLYIDSNTIFMSGTPNSGITICVFVSENQSVLFERTLSVGGTFRKTIGIAHLCPALAHLFVHL
jgi:hypothetical protein